MKKTNTITIDNEITELTNKQAMLLTVASYFLRIAYTGLFLCILGFAVTMLNLHELWLYCFLELFEKLNFDIGNGGIMLTGGQILIRLSICLLFPLMILKAALVVFIDSKEFGILIEKNENGINYKI